MEKGSCQGIAQEASCDTLRKVRDFPHIEAAEPLQQCRFSPVKIKTRIRTQRLN